VAAWWAGWILTPVFLILTNFLPLLFPTGRPPSARWRPLLWASFTGLVMYSLAAAFAPGPLAGATEFENPFGVAFLGEAPGVLAREIVFFGQIALSLACLASIVVRYRHARSLERQQLKWFTGAFALIFLVLFSGSIAEGFGLPVPPLLWQFLWPLSITAIPIAIGIAILRYRLYDIDLLINRTLVYGALTAALAATYFAAVAVLQNALRPLTGGSELAVAGSTLAVVALFAPLRSRIQRVVDRRFSRSRYDAARTLDAFSARLRDEVDLDAVRADLLGAVRETVRPAHAGVWLRERRS
ncbi:MAG: hypothetical protein M3Q61_05915, partial [Chloroflexota bacterium]|nr:hypothetical protein [Chloroflexota bacterium]